MLLKCKYVNIYFFTYIELLKKEKSILSFRHEVTYSTTEYLGHVTERELNSSSVYFKCIAHATHTRFHVFNRVSRQATPKQRLHVHLPVALSVKITQTLVIIIRIKLL